MYINLFKRVKIYGIFPLGLLNLVIRKMKKYFLIAIMLIGCLQIKAQTNTRVPKIEMVLVKGGTFTMGCTEDQKKSIPVDNGDGTLRMTVGAGDYPCERDELPVHKVQLNDFYIGKYEVTQAQWETIMGSNPSSSLYPHPRRPVETVSWNDVQTFIQKLNSITGKKYRLPTEAEWEYAARGGNKTHNYLYSGSNDIDSVACYAQLGTFGVGQLKANELGIFDMTGNVFEWCDDWYGLYTSQFQSNPKGASSGKAKVTRGGEYFERNVDNLRISYRGALVPEDSGGNLGFRLVLDSN
jgi:formylglycine-generating enzyme required for sulfatase activity